jgi:hypothetical protein
LIEAQGFKSLQIQKEKPITIPDDILGKYLSEEAVSAFNKGGTGIFSITVYAEKPRTKQDKPKLQLKELEPSSCCSPKSGCC